MLYISDDTPQLNQDVPPFRLHVITEYGQSTSLKAAFNQLTERLSPNLSIISVSERDRSYSEVNVGQQERSNPVSEVCIYSTS